MKMPKALQILLLGFAITTFALLVDDAVSDRNRIQQYPVQTDAQASNAGAVTNFDKNDKTIEPILVTGSVKAGFKSE